ncbi:MAG: phenylalanine--tRNA ligase subunit beta [Candidatus Micrarchaeales archaeon]
MPTLEFEKQTLLRITKLSEEELIEAIENLKGEVKENGERMLIELTPERDDLFTLYGLGRAIRNLYSPKPLELKLKNSDYRIKAEGKLRPFVKSFIVKNIVIDEEELKALMNDQENIHKTIGKNREAVAIGVHDLSKINGKEIVYKDVKDGSFIPLGYSEEMKLSEVLEKTEKGKEYKNLVKDFPVFIDSLGIFSFPPILNSERTRVTTQTKELFIEMTGCEENAVKRAYTILIADMLERNCEVFEVKIEKNEKEENKKEKNKKEREEGVLKEEKLEIDKKRVKEINNLLGLKLTQDEIFSLLLRMGYKREGNSIIIPFYRGDILHFYDIIEDVAIAYGYKNLKPEFLKLSTLGRFNEITILENQLSKIMVGNGFQEVKTLSLSSKEEQNLIRKEGIVEIQNPVSNELSCYRISLIPSLLKFLAKNKHRRYPQRIFELGYAIKFENQKYFPMKNLCALISREGASIEEAISVLRSLENAIGIKIKLNEKDFEIFIKGRCAAILDEKGNEIGFVGEISPKALNFYELELPVVGFEITYKFFEPI